MDDRNPWGGRQEALGILQVAYKWRKPLLLVAIISAILAVIFTSPAFIPPLFKSRAVVYPSNLHPYATENATEQMLQIFQSEDIRDDLIKDFDLYTHYKISKNSKYPRTTLDGIMKERINVAKTEFESAEIIIYDTDPLIAARMCDSIISYLNKKVIAITREKYVEVVKINRNQLELRRKEMDSMEVAIKQLRTDYGILSFEEQVTPFSRAYFRETGSGSKARSNASIDSMQKNFAEKGGEYISLKEHLWRVRGSYNDIKVILDNSISDLNKDLTFASIVTRPVPAEKKSSPKRTLIIPGFTLSVLFLSLLLILVIERNRQLRYIKP